MFNLQEFVTRHWKVFAAAAAALVLLVVSRACEGDIQEGHEDASAYEQSVS